MNHRAFNQQFISHPPLMVLGENTKLQQQNINHCQWLKLQLIGCMDKKSSLGHERRHSQGRDVESIRGLGRCWKDKTESTEREKCSFSELLVTLVLNWVKNQLAATNSQKAHLSRTQNIPHAWSAPTRKKVLEILLPTLPCTSDSWNSRQSRCCANFHAMACDSHLDCPFPAI